MDLAVFERRLDDELARAMDRDREVALVVLRSPVAIDQTFVGSWLHDRLGLTECAAFLDATHAAIVVPRLDAAGALDRAAVLVAGTALAAGVAIAPHDGLDRAELVTSGRAIAARAAGGGIARTADLVERLELGRAIVLLGDPRMCDVYALVRRLARGDMPISIYGETGTGKELVAAAVHALSTRAEGPFVAINCAAIPEGLAEAELFGHARGAFTGASAARAGQFEAASGGTLFLDEVAELSPLMQARLLRVLESGEIRRVGETTTRQLDLRIVTATHRDLRAEVVAGRFRQDLLHRLGSARIELPPLRDRPRDLAQLAQAFLAEGCARAGRAELRLAPSVVRALAAYPWPGNVRELRHLIDYAIAVAPETTSVIAVEHLPPAVGQRCPRPVAAGAAHGPACEPRVASRARFRPIAEELQAIERQRMVEALAASAGVQNKAAELIGMPLRTFVTKVRRYAIDRAEWE